ncbi:LacI family DNA-binding transcriptional regulator [Pseudonocardia sp. TRM90224]|uniref:LacI family DNA-binding transcriptional regulator n=1 Tax=Pseudonocardia sp. TRM90224 TaxID=2812678 RepID=UPI001E5F9AC2|nr:LacI family DNA-binding transcriptional regulator [Pseudonocardia sp. TRM90224]
MAVTLKDVAALAGVSVKTVSNVVNGYSFVKPANRKLVEDALVATGYRPNIGARNLRRGRTGFFALMVPELGIPYFGELAAMIITAAHERDRNVLIEQTWGQRDLERSTLASLGPHLVDGAILSPEALEAEDFALLGPDVPVLMVGEHAVEARLDRVAIDNVLAARTAVEHLVRLGRRRIACIGENPRRGTSAMRLQGYREALADAGMPADAELVAPAVNYHRRDGAEAMRALLELPDPPDAVFCFNDMLAVGALRAAAERGVQVPADLAVVGFDGSEEGAYSTPTLTSIAPDKAAIAERAVERLTTRIDTGLPHESAFIQTPFVLEVRESTAGRRA